MLRWAPAALQSRLHPFPAQTRCFYLSSFSSRRLLTHLFLFYQSLPGVEFFPLIDTTLKMDSSSSSSSSSRTAASNVVIRGGHIIPSIRLTPPDTRPMTSEIVPEQDLNSNLLFVPLKTEEIGWESGGLIWTAKRYFYPIVNLYAGMDDHVIGTYRGGPEGYRFVKIIDSDFALADQDDEEEQQVEQSNITESKTSKTSLPKGPATKIQSHKEESKTEDAVTVSYGDDTDSTLRSTAFESSSTPSSSRRGSSSTDGDCSSGADTGTTTPTLDSPGFDESKKHTVFDMAEELEAALFSSIESSSCCIEIKMRLASRTGAVEICSDPVDASRLAGPLKSQLYNNSLGLDRTLTLSESVPAAHFQTAPGRSRSRRPLDSEYSAGWSYEQNMEHEMKATM